MAWPLALASLGFGATAGAADSPPDSEFLEYLGSWDEGDEEWLTVADWSDRSAEGSDARKREEKKDEHEQES